MTKITYIIVLLFAFQTVIAQEKIKFSQKSFKEISKLAKKDSKPIMIYFGLKDNNVCNDFEKVFFSQKKVAEVYNKSFHCYKPNLQSSEGKKLLKQFNINAYPSIVFYGSGKILLHKVVGIDGSYNGILLGENVLNRTNTLHYYTETSKQTPSPMEKDNQLLLDYCDVLYQAGEDYSDQINIYFSKVDVNQLQEPITVDAIVKYSNNIYSPEFIFLAENYTHLHSENYSNEDLLLKVESVISTHILSLSDQNFKVPIEDTLQSLLVFLKIKDKEAISSKVYLDYYKYIADDKTPYFPTMQKYMAFHLSIISPVEIGDYCSDIVEMCDNPEIYNEGLNWIEDAINRENTLELNYIKIQLLVKNDRGIEAQDVLQTIRDMFKDELNDDWNKKLKEVEMIEPSSDEVELIIK